MTQMMTVCLESMIGQQNSSNLPNLNTSSLNSSTRPILNNNFNPSPINPINPINPHFNNLNSTHRGKQVSLLY
jgi:hypothetical protein